MKNHRLGFSMRTSLGLTILSMALVGFVLAAITGEYYRRHAVASHKSVLAEVIRVKAEDLLKHEEEKASELGHLIQSRSEFSEMLRQGRWDDLVNFLDNQFNQYVVSAGLVRLEKLYVFDADLVPLAQSAVGSDALAQTHLVCPGLIDRARRRTGPQRLKAVGQLCLHEQNPYYAVIVPVGGIRVTGYLEVVTDPLDTLIDLEHELGMPLQILGLNGKQRYQSAAWPIRNGTKDYMTVDYPLTTFQGEATAHVAMVADVRPFNDALKDTTYKLTVVSAFVTVAAVVVALLLFNKSTIGPLRVLTQQLRLLRENRAHLGEHIAVGGNRDLRELADDFNKMSSELNALYEQLEEIAYIDPITKLANRARFHHVLNEYVARTRTSDAPFALVIVDVERFKAVNDSLGHNVGDQLLTQIGARLESALRKGDTAIHYDHEMRQFLAEHGHETARLGSDEFALILPGVRNDDDANIVADKIISTMAPPFVLDGKSFKIEVRIGIVLAPRYGHDASQLLRRADVAIAEAKKKGIGVEIYHRENDQHRLFQLNLERDLRLAIENDELALHFQPQLSLGDGRLWGAEALARWEHPTRGFIPPDQFVPLAEQSGLVQPFTLWVLHRAMQSCRQWHAAGFALNVAINLSARNLHVADLARQVQHELDGVGLAAKYVCLEVTEGAVMADPEHALVILNALDQMGTSISIDDFGTGYSSMAYLKRLPADELKIDRSFVRELQPGSSDEVIVRSIVDLAHNMGLRVVAEGIENVEAWNHLCRLGCDLGQGYYMAKPMPGPEFLDWVRRIGARWDAPRSAS